MIAKIQDTEKEACKVANLPTRPNNPRLYGGKALSPEALKARFDALAELAIERLNSLIDMMNDGKISKEIPVLTVGEGDEAQTLTISELAEKVIDGSLPDIMNVYEGKTLRKVLEEQVPEIYVGDGEMPERATIQFILDGSDEEVALKTELEEYIKIELAKRGQLKPEFANSIEELEENGDVSKLYVLPDGYIYAYMLTKADYTNLLPLTTDESGNIYNGIGYKSGCRIGSNGAETVNEHGMCCTGFIPYIFEGGETVRIKNMTDTKSSAMYLVRYLTDKTFQMVNIFSDYFAEEDGVWVGTLPEFSEPCYLRFSIGVIDETSIITVNEEIKGSTESGYRWANTGHAFIPAGYEDNRNISLGLHTDGLIYIFVNGAPIGNGIALPSASDEIVGNVDSDNNIVLSGRIPNGDYTVKYEMEDGSVIDIGKLVLDDSDEPMEIVNQIPISINPDGSLFVGANGEAGYKTDVRLSISTKGESTSNGNGLEVTGYIPVKYDDTVYLKNITIDADTQLVLFFDSSFNMLVGSYASTFWGTPTSQVASAKINADIAVDQNLTEAVAYMRICAKEINADSIITVNQPIS